MDQQVSLLTLFVSVGTSLIGSFVFFWYQKGREKRIKAKISEIDFENEFLNKIKKGNIHLIRSGFRTISISLFLVFFSGGVILSVKVVPYPKVLIFNIYVLASAMWFLAGLLCFNFYRSLQRLKDLDSAKKKLAEKKAKLEDKL